MLWLANLILNEMKGKTSRATNRKALRSSVSCLRDEWPTKLLSFRHKMTSTWMFKLKVFQPFFSLLPAHSNRMNKSLYRKVVWASSQSHRMFFSVNNLYSELLKHRKGFVMTMEGKKCCSSICVCLLPRDLADTADSKEAGRRKEQKLIIVSEKI